jgi:hypothetical protein
MQRDPGDCGQCSGPWILEEEIMYPPAPCSRSGAGPSSPGRWFKTGFAVRSPARPCHSARKPLPCRVPPPCSPVRSAPASVRCPRRFSSGLRVDIHPSPKKNQQHRQPSNSRYAANLRWAFPAPPGRRRKEMWRQNSESGTWRAPSRRNSGRSWSSVGAETEQETRLPPPAHGRQVQISRSEPPSCLQAVRIAGIRVQVVTNSCYPVSRLNTGFPEATRSRLRPILRVPRPPGHQRVPADPRYPA